MKYPAEPNPLMAPTKKPLNERSLYDDAAARIMGKPQDQAPDLSDTRA